MIRIANTPINRFEITPDPDAPSLVALIGEAEAPHAALGMARTRSQKLIIALRQRRKQARFMADTLNTLRRLKVHEVTE